MTIDVGGTAIYSKNKYVSGTSTWSISSVSLCRCWIFSGVPTFHAEVLRNCSICLQKMRLGLATNFKHNPHFRRVLSCRVIFQGKLDADVKLVHHSMSMPLKRFVWPQASEGGILSNRHRPIRHPWFPHSSMTTPTPMNRLSCEHAHFSQQAVK